jgi:hypothetical protein
MRTEKTVVSWNARWNITSAWTHLTLSESEEFEFYKVRNVILWRKTMTVINLIMCLDALLHCCLLMFKFISQLYRWPLCEFPSHCLSVPNAKTAAMSPSIRYLWHKTSVVRFLLLKTCLNWQVSFIPHSLLYIIRKTMWQLKDFRETSYANFALRITTLGYFSCSTNNIWWLCKILSCYRL